MTTINKHLNVHTKGHRHTPMFTLHLANEPRDGKSPNDQLQINGFRSCGVDAVGCFAALSTKSCIVQYSG